MVNVNTVLKGILTRLSTRAQPITSVSEDTPDNWRNIGNGFLRYYTNGLITDQPSRYGILENRITTNSVAQTWYSLDTTDHYYRRGNQNGWRSSWKKILNEDSGIQIVKLWENASPTSSFAAQEIELDLSKCPMVIIEFNLYNGYTYIASVIGVMFKGRTTPFQTVDYTATSNSHAYTYQRNVTVENAKVAFGNGAWKNTGATTVEASINVLIPVAIYGIKGVQ